MTTAQATKPAPAAAEIPPEVRSAPTAHEVIKSSGELVARAQAFQVANVDQYAEGVAIVSRMRGAFKRLEEERLGITRTIDASKERVMAFFRPHTSALEEAARILKDKCTAFSDEQERIAAEARRKAEAEAQRVREEAERKARQEREEAEARARAEREEEERQRRAAEDAERQRREASEAATRAAREAEEARLRGDAEAAARAREESERQARESAEANRRAQEATRAANVAENKATRIEERGEERAQQIEVAAASFVAPVILGPSTKVAGAAKRKNWKFEILDEAKLSRAFLTPDTVKIGKLVQSMKDEAPGLLGEPGAVRVWGESDLAVRGRD